MAFTSTHVLAHHSFAAEFDGTSDPITKSGIVLKVEWTNPHAYFILEVENEAGEFEEWAFEMGSPNGLMRRGWTRNSVPVGTEASVRGIQARDGSLKANAQYIVLTETCERLFAGTSQKSFDENSVSQEACEL